MPRQTKRAGDVTGRNADKLAEQKQAELAARQGEISMINAQAAVRDEETVDLTSGPVAQPPVVEQADQDKVAARASQPAETGGVEVVEEPEVEVRDVEVAPQVREFRVNEDLENVTIGQGTNFNFYEGKKYRAASHIYDHLEEKGFIWH